MASPGRVILHIGAMKSGTTYLQEVLFRNRAELAAQGVLMPGDDWVAQVHAVQDVLAFGLHGHLGGEVHGRWGSVVDQIHRWEGHRALISMEFLCYADEDQVARIVDSLAPWDVEVVLTARDLQRTVPAAWQDRMRNGVSIPWPEFRAAVQDGEADEGTAEDGAAETARSFWREQDLTRILEVWSSAIPKDRITVITVPPSGAARHELLERFCRAIGVDASMLDPEVPFSNESIGLASTLLLQRINAAVEGVVPWPVYNRVVKHYLVTDILAPADKSPRVMLGPEDHAWILDFAKRLAGQLDEAGYPVVGSLADLVPAEAPRKASRLEDVSSEEILRLAEQGLVGLLRRYESDVKELGCEAQDFDNAAPSEGGPAEPSPPRGLRSLLERASEGVPLLMRTRRGVAAFRGHI